LISCGALGYAGSIRNTG